MNIERYIYGRPGGGGTCPVDLDVFQTHIAKIEPTYSTNYDLLCRLYNFAIKFFGEIIIRTIKLYLNRSNQNYV